jgi:hypothetical protein
MCVLASLLLRVCARAGAARIMRRMRACARACARSCARANACVSGAGAHLAGSVHQRLHVRADLRERVGALGPHVVEARLVRHEAREDAQRLEHGRLHDVRQVPARTRLGRAAGRGRAGRPRSAAGDGPGALSSGARSGRSHDREERRPGVGRRGLRMVQWAAAPPLGLAAREAEGSPDGKGQV